MATLGSPLKARGSMWRAGAPSMEQTQLGVFGQGRSLPSTRPRGVGLLAMMLNHLQLSGRFRGRCPEMFAIGVDEALGGLRRHDSVVLVTIDEPDLDAFVIVSRRLLDAGPTHLVQSHTAHQIAISVVASQLKQSLHQH